VACHIHYRQNKAQSDKSFFAKQQSISECNKTFRVGVYNVVVAVAVLQSVRKNGAKCALFFLFLFTVFVFVFARLACCLFAQGEVEGT